MKRFCQTLKLKEDPALVREYVRVHQEVWPEIKAGIREVGITDMEIYIHENTLFMTGLKTMHVSRLFPAKQNGKPMFPGFNKLLLRLHPVRNGR